MNAFYYSINAAAGADIHAHMTHTRVRVTLLSICCVACESDEQESILRPTLTAFVHTQCKPPDPFGTRKPNPLSALLVLRRGTTGEPKVMNAFLLRFAAARSILIGQQKCEDMKCEEHHYKMIVAYE